MNQNIPTHAAKAVIKNEAGDMLFLQRSAANGGVTNWDLPGGLVEQGESAREALAREITEELGVAAVIGAFIAEWSFHRAFDDATVRVTNYEATVEDTDFILSDEHIDSRWIPRADVPGLSIKDASLLEAIGNEVIDNT